MSNTLTELRTKFDTLRGRYGVYHNNILTARRYYDMDFVDEVLPVGARARGFKAVIPTTARRIIDEATDHVLYVPKVKTPVRPTKSKQITEQEIAEKKRKAVVAWWRQVTQRFNPLGDARKTGFLEGMIAIKQTCRLDLLPDKDSETYRRDLERLGRYDFLWDVELLDNTTVFPDPYDPRNPSYVYLYYTMDVEQARKAFPASSAKAKAAWRDRGDLEKVDYLEYWSMPTFLPDGSWERGQFVQWIDTEPVHEAPNPYPYIPIAIDDTGNGLVRNGVDPEKRFVGLLDHSYSVLVAQARQWSAMEAVAELTAFNPVIARNLSAEKQAALRVGPGEIWNLEGNEGDTDAEQIAFVQWPDIPPIVARMIALTDKEVNGKFKVDTLAGIPQRGVDTATEADQNVRNASAMLTGMVAALERIATKMTRWMLMDIERVFEAPVTLFGSGANDPADITLSPKEINGYYDCFVQLRTTDEASLDLTRARFWADLYQRIPFLSAWTAMEAGDMADDPLAEMIRRKGEDVFNSPQFDELRVASGVQSFGEFAAYIANLASENGITPPPNPLGGSDRNLIEQESINSPVETRIVDDAYADRDVNQGGSQLRA